MILSTSSAGLGGGGARRVSKAGISDPVAPESFGCTELLDR